MGCPCAAYKLLLASGRELWHTALRACKGSGTQGGPGGGTEGQADLLPISIVVGQGI